jgi:hypothetical protein
MKLDAEIIIIIIIIIIIKCLKYMHIIKLDNNRVGENINPKLNYPLPPFPPQIVV